MDAVTSRNPPAVPADTSPEVWRRQMDAIAARSVTDRLEEWAALNRAGAEMEAEAVRRRHPDYSDREVFLALVRLRYGDELAGAAWPECLTVTP
jgi:hypothetical protein